MTPRINPRKEYESPINTFRIIAGLTHKELAVRAGVQCAIISTLANGTSSLIKEKGKGRGQLKEDAKRLCEFFRVGPEVLFPRYFCSLDRSHKFDIQPYETWSERAADNCGAQLENRDFAWVLIKKGMADATTREIRVFIAYLFNDETFAEIARKEQVSAARVADNFRRALWKIVNAAQKLGFPINAASCRMKIKQRSK
jgi:transcriptional regulator with XRE-family HTH domain